MTVIHSDCLDAMRAMPDASVDSIVSDPPYGLAFMGKAWDHGVPGVSFWAEALRVAKPGAYLVAFGGTRTYHRLACAIEDAGWEIRDCLSWLYGSGFPKSHDVSKAMDKMNGEADAALRFCQWFRASGVTRKAAADAMVAAGHISPNGTMAGHYFAASYAGQPAMPTAAIWRTLRPLCADVPAWVDELVERIEAEREVVGRGKSGIGTAFGDGEWARGSAQDFDITAPATDLARQWQGWGTALKPAWEPIILARKPLVGTVAANVAAHGTGALNVDGCRIGTTVETWPKTRQRPADGVNGYTRKMQGDDVGVTVSAGNAPSGRWPANVCLDEHSAALLDAQSGERGGGSRSVRVVETDEGRDDESQYRIKPTVGTIRDHGDSGGASRFFYCAKAPARERWGILTCDCQATRLPAWESEDQNHDAQTDATSPERGTCAGSSEVECASITPSSGRPHTGRSLPDGKSITSTATSKTTASTTCDSSPRPNTSASTPDASCGMASGGSHAGSVASESPSTPTTGTSAAKGGRSTGVVGPVTSLRLSATSVCESCGGKLRVESHPTQKPIALMRWLVRLVTPPNGLVLDPFTGSGTTGCAAVLEGFRFLGCEREAEYVAIAEKRIAYWAAQKAPEPEPSLF